MVIILKYEENKSIKFFFFKYWINDHLHRPVLWWHTMTRERLWQDMSAPCFTSTCQMLMSHAVRYTPPAGSHVTVTHEWNASIHVNNMERIWAFTVVIISAQFLHLCPTVCVFVLQKGYNLTSTVFFHTQIDKKAILRSWKKCMRTKLQKNELWL